MRVLPGTSAQHRFLYAQIITNQMRNVSAVDIFVYFYMVSVGSTECDSEDEKYGLIKKFSAGCVLKYLYMSQKYIHMWNPKYVIIHNR